MSGRRSHTEVTRPRSAAGSSLRLVTASQHRSEDQRATTCLHNMDLRLISRDDDDDDDIDDDIRAPCLLS